MIRDEGWMYSHFLRSSWRHRDSPVEGRFNPGLIPTVAEINDVTKLVWLGAGLRPRLTTVLRYNESHRAQIREA